MEDPENVDLARLSLSPPPCPADTFGPAGETSWQW